jgi:hypothetical protein
VPRRRWPPGRPSRDDKQGRGVEQEPQLTELRDIGSFPAQVAQHPSPGLEQAQRSADATQPPPDAVRGLRVRVPRRQQRADLEALDGGGQFRLRAGDQPDIVPCRGQGRTELERELEHSAARQELHQDDAQPPRLWSRCRPP